MNDFIDIKIIYYVNVDVIGIVKTGHINLRNKTMGYKQRLSVLMGKKVESKILYFTQFVTKDPVSNLYSVVNISPFDFMVECKLARGDVI